MINNAMNADEIVRALRWLAKETEFIFAAENLNGAAALIESLQAQLAELRKECDIADAANTALHGALEESRRRERAAVEDLETAVSCITCVHDFDCEHSNSCGCSTGEYRWRGPQEAGSGGTE